MMILAAIERETPRGWGNTVGILCGLLAIYLIWRVDEWWKARRGKTGDPSPTDDAAPAPRETRRSRPVSSHVSPDETPVGADAGGWYGRIVRDSKGIGRRVWTNARAIATTGESAPREDASPQYVDDSPDEVDDLADVWDFDADFVDDRPAVRGSAEQEVQAHQETRTEYVARCMEGGVSRPRIVAGLVEHYGVSRAQAYRLVPPDERAA